MDTYWDDFDFYEPDDVEIPEITFAIEPDLDKYLKESHTYWQMIPLPVELAPTQPGSLASLTDEELLSAPVSLVCHVLRTEASGGLQVISPRQTPLAEAAHRTSEPVRTPDMYLVGARAGLTAAWPTVRGFENADLLPFEPLDAGEDELAHRDKTWRESLVSAGDILDDPILKSFICARSLCDLVRRPDVGGDAETLGEVFSQAWALEGGMFSTLAYASLAPPGDLLRYAIGNDDAFPVLNAPIQARRVISVGTVGHSRALYGEYSAVDWRRIRVLCEAVFYLSCRSEGYSVVELATQFPAGDVNANPIRQGILQFRAAPGVVWSTNPRHFALFPTNEKGIPRVYGVHMLKGVAEAVEPLISAMTPMELAAHHGSRRSTAKTQRRVEITSNPETLVAGYTAVISRLHTFYVRGRTAASTVRAMIFQDLSDLTSPLSLRALWVTAGVRTLAHALGVDISRDNALVSALSARFTAAASDIRQKMAVSCSRKGMSLVDAWDDLRAQLPSYIADRPEGTGTWAMAMAWMMINPPTGRWVRLLDALRHTSIGGMASASAHSAPLPAVIGSKERVMAAVGAGINGLSRTFGMYYGATAEACYLFSECATVVSQPALRECLKISGRAWAVRASLATTLSFRVSTPADRARMKITGDRTEITLTVAPYNAYRALRSQVLKSRSVSPIYKAMFPEQVIGEVSPIFQLMDTNIGAHVPETRYTRYAARMARLTSDMEKTITEFRNDLLKLIQTYEHEGRPEQFTGSEQVVGTGDFVLDFTSIINSMENTFYDYISKMPYPDNEVYESRMMTLPEDQQSEILSRRYNTLDDLIATLALIEEETLEKVAQEAVV